MDHLTEKLHAKLSQYVDAFDANDEELYPQLIPNSKANAYLAEQIPLLDCPDSEIEEIYYFRWWVFRKHWKKTEHGHILTEFLPNVPWSGPHNTINCASGFHIREGRWLADKENWLKEYINFWLDGHGNADSYSAWYAHAVWEYCTLRGDDSYGIQKLPELIAYYQRREKKHQQANGLYWSCDDRDGMEYSISGSGLRPTINAYAYGDAVAISRFAALAGDIPLSQYYRSKAVALKEKVEAVLWQDGFFKTIPGANGQFAMTGEETLEMACDVKELAGYIPWYFDMPGADKAEAFRYLLQKDGFAAPVGLTTAQRNHPRYMEPHDHECLWNGPVWPFATSQVLVAVSNLLRHSSQTIITSADFYDWLLQYARSQHRVTDEGTRIPWIDEVLDPETGDWISRGILKELGWQEALGGRERGKDYNHSLFCDLVLSGLLGIDVNAEGELTVSPLIPEWWSYFCVDNLQIRNKRYRIVYDKDGTHYGIGSGISISCVSDQREGSQ